MTKRQIIDDIILLNRSAKPEFLAQFDNEELDAYLRHLRLAQTPRLSCTQGQYSKYFQNVPAAATGGPGGQETFTEPDDHLEQPEPAAQQVAQPPPGQATLFSDDLEDPTPAAAAAWANHADDDAQDL